MLLWGQELARATQTAHVNQKHKQSERPAEFLQMYTLIWKRREGTFTLYREFLVRRDAWYFNLLNDFVISVTCVFP